jgi:hypothetical protein
VNAYRVLLPLGVGAFLLKLFGSLTSDPDLQFDISNSLPNRIELGFSMMHSPSNRRRPKSKSEASIDPRLRLLRLPMPHQG